MNGWFWLVSIVGIGYFVLRKRTCDLFTVAFFSACVYFLPGFFGRTREGLETLGPARPLEAETYLIMCSVLLAIFLGAIVYDSFPACEKRQWRLCEAQVFSQVLLAMAGLGFILTCYFGGTHLLSPDRQEVLDHFGRWHIVWVFSASLATIAAYLQRQYLILLLGAILILADVYLGSRATFAMTFISIAMLALYRKGAQRLLFESKREFFLVLIIGLSIFAYKYLYVAVKLQDWERVAERVNDPQFMELVIMGSEPFSIQTVLNEVVRYDFHVGMAHLSGIVYHLGVFSSNLGAEAVSFNSLFQPVLFPNQPGGLANSIWAQMWSAGDWPLLLMFLVLFVVIIGLLSSLLQRSDAVFSTLIALIGAYWGFFIHRNDIGFEIDLEKRVFFIWFIAFLISALLGAVRVKATELPNTASEQVDQVLS